MEQKEIYIETERIIIRNFKQKDAEGLLDYLFREAGARRIYGFVEDDNIRSIGIFPDRVNSEE